MSSTRRSLPAANLLGGLCAARLDVDNRDRSNHLFCGVFVLGIADGVADAPHALADPRDH